MIFFFTDQEYASERFLSALNESSTVDEKGMYVYALICTER